MPRYMQEMFNALQGGDAARASELQIRIWLDGESREPDQVDPVLRAKALAMNLIPVTRKTFLLADMQPVCPLDPCALTRLNKVCCPVFIVVGALDQPEVLRAADILASGTANARKVIMDQSGHVPSYEQADVFNVQLLTFLSEAGA